MVISGWAWCTEKPSNKLCGVLTPFWRVSASWEAFCHFTEHISYVMGEIQITGHQLGSGAFGKFQRSRNNHHFPFLDNEAGFEIYGISEECPEAKQIYHCLRKRSNLGARTVLSIGVQVEDSDLLMIRVYYFQSSRGPSTVWEVKRFAIYIFTVICGGEKKRDVEIELFRVSLHTYNPW